VLRKDASLDVRYRSLPLLTEMADGIRCSSLRTAVLLRALAIQLGARRILLRSLLPEHDEFALCVVQGAKRPHAWHAEDAFSVLVIYSAFFLTRAVFGVEKLPHMRV
jgi:hypothetical protein